MMEPDEDASPTKRPVLKDSRRQVQVNPRAKAKLLMLSFFPEHPNLEKRRSAQSHPYLADPDIKLEHITMVI